LLAAKPYWENSMEVIQDVTEPTICRRGAYKAVSFRASPDFDVAIALEIQTYSESTPVLPHTTISGRESAETAIDFDIEQVCRAKAALNISGAPDSLCVIVISASTHDGEVHFLETRQKTGPLGAAALDIGWELVPLLPPDQMAPNTEHKAIVDEYAAFEVHPRRSAPPPRLEDQAAEYRVWYATNRKPLAQDDPAAGFGNEQSQEISYGSCSVYVPKSHKIGSTGSRLWWRVLFLTDDRLYLQSIERMQPDDFWQTLQATTAACRTDQQFGVIYVHGFNTSFEKAAVTAAQIGFDLQIQGPMAFFSWPSRGSATGYAADESTIEDSEEALQQFILDFAQKSGASHIHLIAHSMGNRGALRAAEGLARQGVSAPVLSQIILAAPDVGAQFFVQRARHCVTIGRRTTLYASDKDFAVYASGKLHRGARAGFAPPVTVARGVDTILAGKVDVTLLGHGYVADSRPVLQDMYAVINQQTPPARRFGLKAAKTPKDEAYWIISA
jgi:esterase/lipase superfamily enzyme